MKIVALAGIALVGVAVLAAPKHESKAAPKKTTYAGSVAAILNRSCVRCHRPGEVAPFSLVGYSNAKKWANSIALATQSRQMPPWKAVKGFGEFRSDYSLSDADIATLRAWAKSGAPHGSEKEPKAPTFRPGWELGEPDFILQAPKPYHLPAEGQDVYRNFVIKTPFTTDQWVKGLDVQAGNRAVVHHVIVFIDEKGYSERLEAKNKDGQPGYTTFGGVGFLPSGSLGGWAPGLNKGLTPPGTAFKLKAGARLVLQVHYHLSGKPETDQTKVALYLAKEPITTPMRLAWLLDYSIKIPAGEANYKPVMERKIRQDITLYSAMPHMHLLGKSMKATVIFPDGSQKPLVWVDDWDFNWQMSYALKEPMFIPKGSRIRVEARFDNSAENLRNPSSPPRNVEFGEQTTDEMFLLLCVFSSPDPTKLPYEFG